MADLLIIRRRNLTYIRGNSSKGNTWIKTNIEQVVKKMANEVVIQSELVEDFIKDLDKDEITYDFE